jgi:hypothetical protein
MELLMRWLICIGGGSRKIQISVPLEKAQVGSDRLKKPACNAYVQASQYGVAAVCYVT